METHMWFEISLLSILLKIIVAMDASTSLLWKNQRRRNIYFLLLPYEDSMLIQFIFCSFPYSIWIYAWSIVKIYKVFEKFRLKHVWKLNGKSDYTQKAVILKKYYVKFQGTHVDGQKLVARMSSCIFMKTWPVATLWNSFILDGLKGFGTQRNVRLENIGGREIIFYHWTHSKNNRIKFI